MQIHIQPSSVTQSCWTLCDPMNRSTTGLPVHHQLLEFTQTHVHWISDAIQPSHSLSSRSPPTFRLSQHQDLFKWVSSSHQVAKYWNFSFNVILPMNIHDWFLRMDWLDLLAVQATLKKKMSPDLLRNYCRCNFCHSFLRSITPTVRANLW